MKMLVPIAHKHGFTIINRRVNPSFRNILKKDGVTAALKELTSRLFDWFQFSIKTRRIDNSVILFVYPQTAGFDTLIRLMKKNVVFLYVMDNSFFCIRSYNIDPVLHSECFLCLSNPAKVLDQCTPFPSAIQKEQSIKLLQKLNDVSSQLTFLAQNKNQKKLLELHFGDNIRCTVVGLDTGEFDSCSSILPLPNTHSKIISYDLVYHGADQLAKGVGYFVALATLLPELSCFIPASKMAVESAIGMRVTASNIIFSACSWETGLGDAVKQAKLVLVPSLWSAPIEGALLKSIYHNGNVAVVESKFGFSQEVSDSCDIILLPIDTNLAALKIQAFFREEADYSSDTRFWLSNYLLQNKAENIFTAISREAHA